MPAGNELASDALSYVGRFPYVLGGFPAEGSVDCSSFVNQVLGADFGLRLPGQVKPGYAGTSHGPVSNDYVGWSGASTVGTPQAGDLVIWPGIGAAGHIGIATSTARMVSALNPGLGILETLITDAKPGFHIYRRVGGTGSVSPSGCIPGATLIGMLYVAQASYRANRRICRVSRLVVPVSCIAG